jgi:hypothetical protein
MILDFVRRWRVVAAVSQRIRMRAWCLSLPASAEVGPDLACHPRANFTAECCASLLRNGRPRRTRFLLAHLAPGFQRMLNLSRSLLPLGANVPHGVRQRRGPVTTACRRRHLTRLLRLRLSDVRRGPGLTDVPLRSLHVAPHGYRQRPAKVASPCTSAVHASVPAQQPTGSA